MASPNLNGRDGAGSYSLITNGFDTTAAGTTTLQLASQAGVSTWAITCVGTDDLLVAATINAGLTIDGVAKTCAFTAPAVGSALIFKSSVTDTSGVVSSTTVGVFTKINGMRVGAIGEVYEGSAAFGWTAKQNAAIRQFAGDSSNAKGTLYTPSPANVQTTDATVTTVDSFTPPDLATTIVSWSVVGQRSDLTQGAGIRRTATFRRSGGTVVQIGATSAVLDNKDNAAWDAAIDILGTLVRCRVTGAAATTIQWSAVRTSFSVIN